jgi:Toastrack DUF4097
LKRPFKPIFSALVLAAALALAAPAVAAGAVGSFDRTLHVSGPVDMEIITGSGAIHVRTGDSSTVQIHGTIKASSGWSGPSPEEKVRKIEANPPIQQEANLIRIGHIGDPELNHNVSVSYDVVVPAQTRLHSQAGSGDQSVEGIAGPLRASTGSGGIQLSSIGSDVHAETGSGDIRADSIHGNLTASTGSGSIRAAGVAGEFSGETGSGDIQVQQTAAGRVKVSTGSGRVELAGLSGPVHVETGSGDISAQGQLAADWHLETASGGVTVKLPPASAFDLHAHTGSGRISTDGYSVTLVGTLSKNDWNGKVGAGGFMLEVKTSSGDIRVE